MDLSVWIALVALFFAGGLTPGPAVMLVMSTSLRYRAPTALIPALGVSAANLVWISLAAGGIAAFAAGTAKRLSKIQSGYLYHYAFIMLIGVAGIIALVFTSVGG